MGGDISPPPVKRQRMQENDVLPTDSTDLSLYSWNINGISPFIQRKITSFFKSEDCHADINGETGPSLRTFLSSCKWPTLLFLQEVKISPEDNISIRAVEKAVNLQAGQHDGGPVYITHLTLPSDQHNARGFGRKLYGVCTIIRKDFADIHVRQVRGVEWDAEGRFSVIETKAVGDLPKLVIFNVYMVNGTDNEYRDPATGQMAGTRHGRKLQVHRLLAKECHDLMTAGFEIIIAGDINVARSNLDGHPRLRTSPHQHVINRQDFETRFLQTLSAAKTADKSQSTAITDHGTQKPGLGLTDVFRALHPHNREYSYYPRGVPFGASCDRVDMILCSSHVAARCAKASILATPGDRGTSDHVPIYATFGFERPSSCSGSAASAAHGNT